MILDAPQLRTIKTALRSLSADASPIDIAEFVGRALGVNQLDWPDILPVPDTSGEAAALLAVLTRERAVMIEKEGRLPNYVVHRDPLGDYVVEGLAHFLTHTLDASDQLAKRIVHHDRVRDYFIGRTGHELEAIGAALLDKLGHRGNATQGSKDQGVDAVAQSQVVPQVASADALSALQHDGLGFWPTKDAHLFTIASMKTNEGGTRSSRATLAPAHIRDLVGTLLLQRTEAGGWSRLGIRALTPVFPVLVTTYLLSADSWALCRRTGIHVWSLPELIALSCKYAPDDCFPEASSYAFSGHGFRKWWRVWHTNRVDVR